MGKGLTFTAVAVAVGAALYAGLGYVAVPQGARYALEKIAAEKLQRPVTVGEVSFSPWSWTFELSDLTVGSRTGKHHLLKLGHLRVDASSRSLLELAPVLDAVEVSGLDVYAALDEEKFEELAAQTGGDGAPAETPPAEASSGVPAFAIYNIRLSDSRIRVTDASKGIDESITDLHVELPFVSTLSSARESLLTPVVNFNLNGTPVAATGRTKPFGSSLETELALDVKNLDAARFARIAPALNSPELRLASANLTAHASVLFRNPTGGEPAKIILSGEAALTDVKAETTVGKKREQLAALKKASIAIREVNLVEQRAAVSNVRVEGLTAALDRSNPLLAPKTNAAPAASAPTKNAASPSEPSAWTWSLDSAELVDANLRWTDGTVSPAAKVTVANLKADLKNLASNGKEPAAFSLSADTLRGSLALNGTVRPAPLEVTVKAKGQKLALTDTAGYVRDALGVDLAATTAFDIEGAMRPDATTARGTVSVSGVSLKKGKETLASVNSASVELKDLQLEKRTAAVERVVVEGASVTAVMRKTGLNLAQIGATGSEESGKPEGAAAAEKPSEAASAPWTWTVGEAALKRAKLAFRDETVKPVASAQLSDLNVTLKNLSSASGAKSLVDVSAVIGGGTLNAGGQFTLSPLSAAVEVKADKVGLKSFSNLMTAYAGLGAKSGEFRTAGALGVSSPEGSEKPVVTWKGDASLSNFNMTNAAGKGIMSWTKATLAGMDIATTDPIKIVIAKASVEQPGEKQTKAVRELSGLASAIAALRGNDKTAERIDKVNEALTGTIELENIRYENGRFSAEGIGNGALGAALLEKLSDSIGSHLAKTETATKTETDAAKTNR